MTAGSILYVETCSTPALKRFAKAGKMGKPEGQKHQETGLRFNQTSQDSHSKSIDAQLNTLALEVSRKNRN